MRILENTDFKFVEHRKKAYIFSAVLILLSIFSFATRGLELGIDFLSGMEFVVEAPQEMSAVEVRSVLAETLGSEPEVKKYGETGLLVRTAVEGEISDVQEMVMSSFREAFPDRQVELVNTNIVGPRFAEDLKRGALYAILASLLVVFVYILVRFEWQFGVGAVAALVHDVTITVGIFSLFAGVLPFSLQIDQAIIAGFLTIVGYSINDTVVIFDRIREYTNIFKSDPYNETVDRSINSTLSRTIMTSSTTLLVVTALFIFGGEVLRGFSFALIIGILIGTYSSVFVATPVVVELRHRLGEKKKRRRSRA